MKEGLVSIYWSVDGTLVRADANHKGFVPLLPDEPAGEKKDRRTLGRGERGGWVQAVLPADA